MRKNEKRNDTEEKGRIFHKGVRKKNWQVRE